MPPGLLAVNSTFDHIVGTELHFSALAVPPAVLILRKTGILEVHLAVLDHPPAVLVLLHTVTVKIYFTIDYPPPAVLILGYAGITKVHFTAADIPPAACAVYRGLNNIINGEIHLAVPDHPTSIAVPGSPVVVKVYFSVLIDPPPAVFILGYRVSLNPSLYQVIPGAIDLLHACNILDNAILIIIGIAGCAGGIFAHAAEKILHLHSKRSSYITSTLRRYCDDGSSLLVSSHYPALGIYRYNLGSI